MSSLPWIRLSNDLPDHPKSDALATLLNEPRAWTHVVELWLWASRVRPDGALAGVGDAVIARRAGWTGDAAAFVAALRDAGFLDADGMLHGWDKHQGKYLERLEKDRARKAAGKPPKSPPPEPPEAIRGKSEDTPPTVPQEFQRSSDGVPAVRNDTRRNETKSVAPVADAPDATPRPALALTADAPKARKRPRADASSDPSKGEARTAYLDRFRLKFGSPAADFTGGQAINFWRLLAKHGLETLLASVDGCAADDWTRRNRLLGWVCSAEGVEFGTRQRGTASDSTRPADSGGRLLRIDPPKPVNPRTPETDEAVRRMMAEFRAASVEASNG
jgi:hypothetical protein